MNENYVVLENLRSLFNIGAIFRTCSFFGVEKVVLLGYSGKTHDENGLPILHKEILKTSLGSEKDLNIIFMENVKELIEFSRENNLKIISIEQDKKSVDFIKWDKEDESGALYVFGNEVTGVSEELLKNSDTILEIKGNQKGHNSLNVEATAAIVIAKISKN